MATRVQSILDRLRRQSFLDKRTQVQQIRGTSTIPGLSRQIDINQIPETEQAGNVLEQLSGIDQQLAGLPGRSIPFGEAFGLGGFVTNNENLAQAFQNRTGAATDILRRFRAGTDPASLGLFNRQDIQSQRAALQEQRNQVLLGPRQSEVTTPLQRLGQTLLGVQAQRGLAQGGSPQAFLGAAVPQQVQALLSTGLGQLRQFGGQAQPGLLPSLATRQAPQLGTPGFAELLGPQALLGTGFDEIRGASTAQNRFNVFNPPPFFNLL